MLRTTKQDIRKITNVLMIEVKARKGKGKGMAKAKSKPKTLAAGFYYFATN